ncbi:hypothetical protein ERJ70_03310 [Sediminibacillus dalangtanensis]|uniref:Uncharacterized protein n=1 Tax=Sediminibacillus dalangtanensis TaxID=2729421 RepID=A0ABX7VS41_9BACI|nr:hypothetical protein [Sediminibacillus dalangtanensis]QTM98415.1 hypothetical protein ERJ70_03310 [Sediminibacillus dalangtanensis]
MVVNHGGSLTPNYFKSYIKLVLNANECSLKEAKAIVFKHFFEMKERRFGEETYKNFLLAYKELEKDRYD